MKRLITILFIFTLLVHHKHMLRDWLIEPSTYTIVSGNLTSQDIPISFSANGQYDITLSTFNEGGSSTTTKENYITITDVPLAPSKTMLFVK